MKNILNIREDDIKIAGKAWDDDALQLLAAKKIAQFRGCARYWDPILERGRRFENYFEGKILTSMQKAVYEHNGIIPIEPPIMKAPIRALIGQAMKSRKSGQVVTERGAASELADNTRELETINVVLKDMEIKTKEEFEIKEAMSAAFVSCYWNVLMFDKARPSRNGDGARYKMSALPWSSCVFGPLTARKPDGSDIKEMFYFDHRTLADLIDNYPDMEKQILAHFAAEDYVDSRLLSSVSQWDGDFSSDGRDTMFDVLTNAFDAKRGASGLVQVIMHLFPIKRKEEVWVNIFDDSGESFERRPDGWDDERWNRWVQENSHTYAGPYEREAVTLWMTVFTTSGLVLANQEHWFQESGMLPCSFWLGAVSANVPTGPAADMVDDCLANAVAETEYLNDLRNGSGRLMVVREGAVTTVENLSTEANKPLGLAVVSKDFNGKVSDAITELTRRPNDHWKTYAEQRKAGMYENTRINETMLGEHAPRQSAIAKEAEISQALTVNATYIDNMNRSWEYHQNLKLKMIPYHYTEHEVLEVLDEKTGNLMAVEVNAPGGYDAEGNVASVINDLGAHRYRWKISPVDDSPTARIRNDEDALTVINAAAGPMLQADQTGMAFATFIATQQNPRLRDTGKALLEQAQQSAQAMSAREQQKDNVEMTAKLAKAESELLRAQKNGVILNGRFQDFADFPALGEIYGQIQQQAELAAAEKMAKIQQTISPAQPPMEMASA